MNPQITKYQTNKDLTLSILLRKEGKLSLQFQFHLTDCINQTRQNNSCSEKTKTLRSSFVMINSHEVCLAPNNFNAYMYSVCSVLPHLAVFFS